MRATAVLVHGAGGGAWEWAAWRRALLAAGLVVRAPELHAVPGGLAATGLDDYQRQVDGCVDDCTAPVVLVGASLGGLLAWRAAGRPGVAALVLINPLPPAPWHRALPPAREGRDGVVEWGRRASLAGTRKALPGADAASALLAFRGWRDESARVLAQARLGVPAGVPGVPGLVLISDADADVPPTTSAELAAACGFDPVRLAGAGHVDPLLGRARVPAIRAAVDWLNGLEAFRGISSPSPEHRPRGRAIRGPGENP